MKLEQIYIYIFICKNLLYISSNILALTLPRNNMKSPTVLMAATRKAFSTRMTKASFAEVQKLVLLIAVAVYAFWAEAKTIFSSINIILLC